MPNRTYWTEAQIELTEKARDAAQLAARRAQEAAGLTSGVVEQVQLINAEVAGRQQDIEAVIGANVPDHEWDNGSIRFRNPDGEWGDWTSVRGVAGYAGWAPLLVVETDGERRVLKIESWVGGEGPAPAAGQYIGAAGLVPTAAEAVDVRGAPGADGDTGPSISLVEGTITTGDPGDPADITLTETTPGVWTVDMTIPQGIPGDVSSAVMDEDFSADGIMARTGAGAYASRTITGTSQQITVTNGDGKSGNPTLALASQVMASIGLANTAVQPGDLTSSDSVKDIIRISMKLAELIAAPLGLSAGVSDVFEDASGVDAGASTNETVGDGFYSNLADMTEVSQSLPAMSGNTAPSGHVASANASSAGAEAWRAFDQTIGNRWGHGSFAGASWVQRQTPSAITCREYAIQVGPSEQARAPNTWTLQGSNNGSSWTTLDSRSGITWGSGERKVFTIPAGNRGAYSYHRLNVTANNGDALLMLAELELLQYAMPPSMDLRSVAYTALTAPEKASVTIAAKAGGGTITPNTHLIAYASRDGGTTWTAGTLTAAETLADGTTIYETGDFDISGQPSGTAMKWRVVTGDTFEVQVHAVSLLWR